MNTLPILNKNIGPPEMNVVGRLSHDFAQNEAKVVLRLTEAIIKAHVVMGLNIDAQKVNITAVEALKKIKEVYPHAWLDDVVRSLSMASYGEIKLDDQLTTISPANIFGWYKHFRNNLGHLSTAPPPPEQVTMKEITLEEKTAIMRKAFFAFIDSPNQNDLALDVYYEKLIDIGALNITDKDKNDAYFVCADKMIEAPPYEYITDKKMRKQLYAYQDYFKSNPDRSQMKFGPLMDNFIHRVVINYAKRKLVIEFLSKADKKVIMDLFDKFHDKSKK